MRFRHVDKTDFSRRRHSVTGSRYLVETNGSRILVDCGLFQERELREHDWEPFAVPPKSIDAILLTHPHLDHSGSIPKLAKDGFRGRIYCTMASKEITEVLLLDSASLLMEDAEIKKKRHQSEGGKALIRKFRFMIWTMRKTVSPFKKSTYGKPVVLPTVSRLLLRCRPYLGSASICLSIQQGNNQRTILFSGDLGRQGKPIIMDPTMFTQADYVVIESTYGDRILDLPR